jgi:hypothetical protein
LIKTGLENNSKTSGGNCEFESLRKNWTLFFP